MLLPGPEAMQLATYAGWRLHGVAGGLIAGLLFVLPGALVMLALALAYACWGRCRWVEALFLGIKATVVVIVLEALLRVVEEGAARRPTAGSSPGCPLSRIFVFAVPFPLIIAAAAVYGALRRRVARREAAALPGPRHAPCAPWRSWLALWWAPVALLWAAGAERLTDDRRCSFRSSPSSPSAAPMRCWPT